MTIPMHFVRSFAKDLRRISVPRIFTNPLMVRRLLPPGAASIIRKYALRAGTPGMVNGIDGMNLSWKEEFRG